MSWEINNYIANGIALLGSFTSVVMWLAPVRDVWTASYSIYHTGSTDNVATSFGFVAGVFNCVLWNSKFSSCGDADSKVRSGWTLSKRTTFVQQHSS